MLAMGASSRHGGALATDRFPPGARHPCLRWTEGCAECYKRLVSAVTMTVRTPPGESRKHTQRASPLHKVSNRRPANGIRRARDSPHRATTGICSGRERESGADRVSAPQSACYQKKL